MRYFTKNKTVTIIDEDFKKNMATKILITEHTRPAEARCLALNELSRR